MKVATTQVFIEVVQVFFSIEYFISLCFTFNRMGLLAVIFMVAICISKVFVLSNVNIYLNNNIIFHRSL